MLGDFYKTICTVTIAVQQLHCNNFTATTAMQRLHCTRCSGTHVVQKLHCKKCTATIALRLVHCNTWEFPVTNALKNVGGNPRPLDVQSRFLLLL